MPNAFIKKSKTFTLQINYPHTSPRNIYQLSNAKLGILITEPLPPTTARFWTLPYPKIKITLGMKLINTSPTDLLL